MPVDHCFSRKGRLIIDPNGETRVSADGAFSNAQCMTSLEGVSFVKAVSGDAPALFNGWAQYPGLRAPTVGNRGGVVAFEGAITTTGSSLRAMLLPTKYRPATPTSVLVDLCNARHGMITIQPDGWVDVTSPIIGDAKCMTSLEGVQFGI